jgi:two-component system, OmpR family, sensor histidine kinase KdpD
LVLKATFADHKRFGSVGSCWRLAAHASVRGLLQAICIAVIHIIPSTRRAADRVVKRRIPLARSGFPQYAAATGVVAGVTAAAFVFTPIVGAHATALVFLLAIVLVALIVERGPTLLAAALSALSWDYFFLPPVFAFRIKHFEDVMLFGMYFLVALVLGQLTSRIRAQEEAERRRQERATALFLLTRDLSQANDFEELVQKITHQTAAAFDTPVAFMTSASKAGWHAGSTWSVPESDFEVVAWVFQNLLPAGRFTRNLNQAPAMYLPLRGVDGAMAVLGLPFPSTPHLTPEAENFLAEFSHQITLALDRHRLNQISEKTRLLAESERLSKTLLDSMSHEMRTPLAAIRSAAGNLAQVPDHPPRELLQEMICEVEEATERLDRLVGNILEVSRLESGNVRPRLNECDVSELVNVAVSEADKQLAQHRLTVRLSPGLPLVRMDFVLMQHVLGNLLSNAALHTPPGTHIDLRVWSEHSKVWIRVSDKGPGIPPDSLRRVFNKFYRAPNAPTGGTGLGFSLVKGFVEAHAGGVSAENQPGSGAAFTLWLPLQPARATHPTCKS